MSEVDEQPNTDWTADQALSDAGQAAEMPSVKLFGRWTSDEIAVGLVGA